MRIDPFAINILESVLQQELGLNISSIGKNSIKKALSRRIKQLEIDTFHAYITLLKTSPQELNAFIDEISINETWFYRDEAPFTALSQYASNYLTNNPKETLHFLSVPCSTGEEPYSMAIALLEAGISPQKYSIDAIDINARSLSIARKGIYQKNSFRGQSNRFQHRYFEKEGKNSYKIQKVVTQNVHFHKGNLLNLQIPLTAKSYHAIFCRNLLIYLNDSSHKKVIQILDHFLKDDGLLFIGHSESGLFANSPFQSSSYPKTFSYIKKHPAVEEPEESEKPVIPVVVPPPEPKNDTDCTISEPYSPQNPSLSVSEAKIYAKEGDYKKAISIYERIIQEKGPEASIFYLIGCIFFDTAEYGNSINMLKKAVYLDPDCIDALTLLAQIFQTQGDEQNYKSYSKRAERVKNRLANDR